MQQTYNSGGMSPQAEATPHPKKNYCAAVTIPTYLYKPKKKQSGNKTMVAETYTEHKTECV